jgi:hypothetical protein
VREHLSADAAAGVGHVEHDLAAVPAGGERDAPPGVRVGGRVGEQVGDDLAEPERIGVDQEAGGRHLHGERVRPPLHQGARDLEGSGHHGGELDELPAQLDLAAGDPRHVHQVVDQPPHVLCLAADDRALPQGTGIRAVVHQLEGGGDGRERVAQLVAEHREELVLAPIGLGEPAQRLGALRGEVAEAGLRAAALDDLRLERAGLLLQRGDAPRVAARPVAQPRHGDDLRVRVTDPEEGLGERLVREEPDRVGTVEQAVTRAEDVVP